MTTLTDTYCLRPSQIIEIRHVSVICMSSLSTLAQTRHPWAL